MSLLRGLSLTLELAIVLESKLVLVHLNVGLSHDLRMLLFLQPSLLQLDVLLDF